MSKAQTDIRTTSYDAATANLYGYTGTLDDALAQVRAETQTPAQLRGRAELLEFLGATKPRYLLSGVQHGNPDPVWALNLPWSAEDDSVVYGAPERVESTPAPELSPYSLEYAQAWWPHLTQSQRKIYAQARQTMGVKDALAKAEAYPYPAVRSGE